MAKCSVCGKEIAEGYVWDGTDIFCSEECLKTVFPDDPEAATILIDDDERIAYVRLFDIKTTDDVRGFFSWLVDDMKINFHPDDDFKDYICYETKQPTFTTSEAEYYNKVMDKCFVVCDENGADIYDIGIVALLPF